MEYISGNFRLWMASNYNAAFTAMGKSSLHQPSTKEWQNGYRTYIGSILSGIIDKTDLCGIDVPTAIEQMTSPLGDSESPLRIWMLAVTDPFSDINKNYEVLETLGDAVLRQVTHSYFIDQLGPKADSGVLTNLEHILMSTNTQPYYTWVMKLDKWLITSNPKRHLQSSVREDLFESFFGALDVTSRMINQPGITNQAAYRLLSRLYHNVRSLDEVKKTGVIIESYKTVVLQRGDKMGWGKEPQTQFHIKSEQQSLGKIKVTLRPKDKLVEYFNGIDKSIPPVFTSSDKANNAEEDVYNQVYRFYEENKLTEVDAKMKSRENLIKNLDSRFKGNKFARAEDKARSQGFSDIFFKTFEKSKAKVYINSLILVGTKTDEKGNKINVILSEGYVNSTDELKNRKDYELSAQNDALSRYLEKN